MTAPQSQVQQLLAAAIRHKLTPVEWQLFAALLTTPEYSMACDGRGHFRQPGANWSDGRIRCWGFTQQGYSKAIISLEARGWIKVDRSGRHDGPSGLDLLPLIILADGAPESRPNTTAVSSKSTDNKRCRRSTTTSVAGGRRKGGR